MSTFAEQLQSLDRSDVARWPTPFRLGAVGLIFVAAVSLLTYMIAWSPNRPVLEKARLEEQTLLGTLEQKAKKAVNLQPYKAQLEEMEQSFGAMLRQLPNKTEVPNLLVDISQTGLSSGLEEKLFQPTPETTRDFYAELPIKIRLTGSFHAIGTFVSGIAALPRIVTLHDIQIGPLAKASGNDQLELNVTARTYRYLDEEEQAAVMEKENKAKGKDKGKKGKGKKPQQKPA